MAKITSIKKLDSLDSNSSALITSIEDMLKSNKIDYLRNVRQINANLFGGDKTVEFFIKPSKKRPKGVFIHPRHQRVQGTIDQKFPYLVGCINLLAAPSIIVLDGEYWDSEPPVLNWLHKQVEHKHLIGIVHMKDFAYWLESV